MPRMSGLHRAIPKWLLTIVAIALLVVAAPLFAHRCCCPRCLDRRFLPGGLGLVDRASDPARPLRDSDSSNWKEYIEQQILPRLPQNAVVLNWSHRKQWPRFSLAVLLFRAFAGDQEFNPIALVFARFRFVERFRFWQSFRHAKHGKDEPLKWFRPRSLSASKI